MEMEHPRHRSRYLTFLFSILAVDGIGTIGLWFLAQTSPPTSGQALGEEASSLARHHG